MKGKTSLALLILLLISALAFYVSAQVQPDKQQEIAREMLKNRVPQSQLERFQEEKRNAVRETLLIDQQHESVEARIQKLEKRVSELEKRIAILESQSTKKAPIGR